MGWQKDRFEQSWNYEGEAILMPARPSSTNNFKNTAIAAHTATDAETTTTAVTASFPGNSTAIPRRLRVSGSVSGFVELQVSQNQYISLPANPNAPFTEIMIPPSAFSGPVTGVSLLFQADDAGTIRAFVDGV
jgi:hypothetical protein